MYHNRIFSSLLCILALFFIYSCKKNPVTVITDPPPVHGKVTPKGTPIGDPITKTIGASGGTIVNADSSLWVTVPAGAIDHDIVFAVQPITNNTPQGIGNAYRLLPEGIAFQKPVTITFHYRNNQLTGTVPEAIFPSYQDTAGIWQAITNCSLDKSAQTISVQSSHFSDWSDFDDFELHVEKAEIGTGEKDHLVVSEEPLANLNADQQPLGDPVTSGKVSNWRISYGTGTLTHNGGSADYTAPPSVPDQNPVQVDVEIRNIRTNQGSNGIVLLTASILIQDEYMDVSIDGTVTRYSYCEAYNMPSYTQIIGGDDSTNWVGQIAFKANAAGSFPFDAPTVIDGTSATVKIGNRGYFSYYIPCNPPQIIVSPGGVTLTKVASAVSQYTEGTLTGTMTYSYRCDHDSRQVTIHFRAKQMR